MHELMERILVEEAQDKSVCQIEGQAQEMFVEDKVVQTSMITIGKK